jgi:murein DD-endopeptidase MepM/ murein hydrolase activator NlpD
LAPAWLALALAGCAGLFPQTYGEAAPDADPVRADGRPVYMPPNAPSILNGHWEAGEGHQGIDIPGPVGTPVLAPAPGRVSDSWFGPMCGHQILIDHGRNTEGRYIRTRLVHLDARSAQPGEQVARGQAIGSLGRTGLLSGGIPHLHY